MGSNRLPSTSTPMPGGTNCIGSYTRRRCLWHQYALLGRHALASDARGWHRRSAGRGLCLQLVLITDVVWNAGRGLDPPPCGQLWRRWDLLRGLCRRGVEPRLAGHRNGQRVDLIRSRCRGRPTIRRGAAEIEVDGAMVIVSNDSAAYGEPGTQFSGSLFLPIDGGWCETGVTGSAWLTFTATEQLLDRGLHDSTEFDTRSPCGRRRTAVTSSPTRLWRPTMTSVAVVPGPTMPVPCGPAASMP